MPQSAAAERLVSLEEYLRLEEASPVKHEYVAGRIFALAGPTKRHNIISLNLAVALRAGAVDGPCRVYVVDVKLRAAADVIYYPDVMVACGPEDGDPLVELAPCLVVEVLSPSTAATDRREKLLVYRAMPSLLAYLIVDQEERRVERHWRGEDGQWRAAEYRDGVVPIPCPEMELPIEAVYRGALPAA